MFIGRKHQLELLEKAWNADRFRMPVMYGRRRVGKTAILREFSKDKNPMFLLADIDKDLNIYNLKELMREHEIRPLYDDLPNLLKQIFREAQERRILFIVDEFPWLVQSCPSVATTMQHEIDRTKENSGMMAILCGSSISYMQWKVLGYQSPLFGRNTSEMHIRPFTLFECMEFLPDTEFSDLCEIYGMIDGTPAYLDLMQNGKGLRENFLETFDDESSYLVREAFNLLKIELPDPELYSKLLSIVAKGPLKPGEIADKMSGMDVSRKEAGEMIRNLVGIAILKGETPLGADNRKSTLYGIDDLYFRFWHRFMPQIGLPVKNGRANSVFPYVQKRYSQYMGGVFEKICAQWILHKYENGEFPLDVTNIGRWWGNNPMGHKQEEIDLIVSSLEGDAIFCECKWRNEKTDASTLYDLKRKSMFVKLPKNAKRHYMLFSKAGFTDACIEMAEQEGHRLIDLDILSGKAEKPRENPIPAMRM